jgi:ferric-dicitrate binding protein FerR (iron transport regulator)
MLNSLTTLKYPEQFSDSVRRVELAGEAFFKVKRDVNRAFVVGTGRISTRVLGTSFNIRNNKGEENILIALLSGRVNIQTPAQSFTLEKGDMAVFDRETETTNLKQWDYVKDFGWKDGILYFDRATMVEIAGKLEDWYGVNITIIGKNHKRGHFTGSFNNESLKNVLESLSFTFDFSYKWEGDNVSIHF